MENRLILMLLTVNTLFLQAGLPKNIPLSPTACSAGLTKSTASISLLGRNWYACLPSSQTLENTTKNSSGSATSTPSINSLLENSQGISIETQSTYSLNFSNTTPGNISLSRSKPTCSYQALVTLSNIAWGSLNGSSWYACLPERPIMHGYAMENTITYVDVSQGCPAGYQSISSGTPLNASVQGSDGNYYIIPITMCMLKPHAEF